MSIYFAHINTAIQLLRGYEGSLPFHLYLKQFFQKNKKYGSKDRRNVTMLCYNFFRLNALCKVAMDEETLLQASFIVEEPCPNFIKTLRPHWPQNLENKQDRLQYFGYSLSAAYSPWLPYLSETIELEAFFESIITQPKLFLRLKPGNERKVMDKLDEAEIAYTRMGIHALALANSSKIHELLHADKEVQIQDYSSQAVAFNIADTIICDDVPRPSIWDCCAASGGKSLHLFDYLPQFNLTVSDLRPSILQNLQQRFATAGLSHFASLQVDLTQPVADLADNSFDYILADVPCSGSGTWARNPENFQGFSLEVLQNFAQLQRLIVANIVPKLKVGGRLFYITCSAFSMENEQKCTFLQSNFPLSLRSQGYQIGAQYGADTMFLSIFTKTKT